MKAILTLLFVISVIYWFIYIIELAQNQACIHQYNQIQKIKDSEFYSDELKRHNKNCN